MFKEFHTKPDYQNQHVTQINREPAHSPWHAYENATQAKEKSASQNVCSLDGQWKFYFAHNIDALPNNFLVQETVQTWPDIMVPGHWELQGYSAPVYTNVLYPFQDTTTESYLVNPSKTKTSDIFERYNPPYVPEENNVGVYQKNFTLPAHYEGKDVFVEFDGVESSYYLYVNGHAVGYSQDSKLPSSFEITKYVTSGENSICLVVFRFCDGTWLEDQDYFHISGIYRSVRLVAKPKVRIRDYVVDAMPDCCLKNGKLTARCFVNRVDGFADHKVKLELFDSKGQLKISRIKKIDTTAPIMGLGSGMQQNFFRPLPEAASFCMDVQDIQLWSCDDPILYTVVFTLLDENEETIDFESCHVGFRKICIENNVIKLNGKRIVFRGVNRHDHAYETGRTISREHMIKEIILMKRLNFNSVRTCHYPDNPLWYDLCDEYGLLLVCETNLETHGIAGAITNNPEWAEAMLERAKRMVLTHKNHPSIVSWSMGNESGYGPNHASMANWVREYDSTRLVQYENNDPGAIASDIKCSMYPPIDRILEMIADNNDHRPIVLVEYAYQIANTTGGYELFNHLAETYDIFQGGFVWDWQDKCLPAKTKDGQTFVGFGGDYDEDFVEWACPKFMCANGVVLADLTPKPCAYEIKQGQSPVMIEMINSEDGVFIFRNRFHSICHTQLLLTYEIVAEGSVIESGNITLVDVDCNDPEEVQKINKKRLGHRVPKMLQKWDYLFELDLSKVKNITNEVYVNVKTATAVDFPWAAAGHEVALQQFMLKGRKSVSHVAAPKGKVSVSKDAQRLIIAGENFKFIFDMQDNLLLLAQKDGVQYFETSGREEYDRDITGLHLGERWWGDVEAPWQSYMPGMLTRKPICSRWEAGAENENVRVTFQTETLGNKGSIVSEISYQIFADGSFEVFMSADADENFVSMPRVGLEFVIPSGFEELEWYGRGPGESYCDRTLSSPIGLYHTTVEETHFPFVPVSHNGTHAETRYVVLKNDAGKCIKISGAPFYFTAHHNSVLDYRKVFHEHELIRKPETYLNIDGWHTGIGGNIAWSTEIDEKHLMQAKAYMFKFRVELI